MILEVCRTLTREKNRNALVFKKRCKRNFTWLFFYRNFKGKLFSLGCSLKFYESMDDDEKFFDLNNYKRINFRIKCSRLWTSLNISSYYQKLIIIVTNLKPAETFFLSFHSRKKKTWILLQKLDNDTIFRSSMVHFVFRSDRIFGILRIYKNQINQSHQSHTQTINKAIHRKQDTFTLLHPL